MTLLSHINARRTIRKLKPDPQGALYPIESSEGGPCAVTAADNLTVLGRAG